jgi:hypothetical protein
MLSGQVMRREGQLVSYRTNLLVDCGWYSHNRQFVKPAKRMLLRLCVLIVVAAMGTVAPSSAQANGRPYVWTSAADLFWCTSVQSLCANQAITTVPGGTSATMVCWRDDRQPFPNSSSRWFYVFLDNGQEGYLWSEQVRNQTPNTPNCNTINWINVSDWAIGRIGLTHWRSANQDGPYAPGRSGHYWSGWCLTFASDAWAVAGGGNLLGGATANDAWSLYAGQGRVDTAHRPPRGAMVFWNVGSFGHVAISIGNWKVVGTRGDEPQTLPIADYGVDPSGQSLGTYRGWVMPTTSAPYNTMGW